MSMDAKRKEERKKKTSDMPLSYIGALSHYIYLAGSIRVSSNNDGVAIIEGMSSGFGVPSPEGSKSLC